VVLSFSAGGIQGEQLYGPYGNQRYIEGVLGTDKGYTGQFADSVTGLDYYNARWYDPVSGRFLSPDTVQGNAQGMDPYAYVEGNPETVNDPTGQKPVGCMPNDPGCSPWGTPTNCGKDQNQPCGNEPTHPTGGVPDPGPGSGGCEKGWHLTNSGCAQNGSDCLVGMHSGKGGCVYDRGECQGLTSAGCTQFKISLAQEEAQQEVVHLSILMGVMLLLMADLAGWVTKLEDAAAWFATLALGDSMTVVGAIFFGTLSALAAGAAILLAGSMSTLATGAITDSALIAMFEGRAIDENPSDWTPAALSQFDFQVHVLTGVIDYVVSPVFSLLSEGWVSKIIGFAEPTSVFYGFSGVDATLAQMTADMRG